MYVISATNLLNNMVYVRAHSMVSSLGCDVGTACASARAGLSRAREIGSVKLASTITGEAEPVIGHSVPLLTQGFEGDARLQRLLSGGLNSLKAHISDEVSRDHDSVGFYLSLPTPERLSQGQELIPDEDSRDQTHTVGLNGREYGDTTFAHALLVQAAQHSGWSGKIDLRFVALSGHTGGAECILAAERDLDNGTIALAIVGAADSLLDEATLVWLQTTNRLKYSDLPIGLVPGEACVFVALSTDAQNSQAEIGAIGLCAESKTLLSGETSVGEGLAEALNIALVGTKWQQDTHTWIISDQNGEVYRANEWGHALARARGAWPALEKPIVWLPAISYGDTGAASALIAVCTALQAFARNYAPSPGAVITSSSEGALRSVFSVLSI